ncbi:CHRD domain-containing protein [Rhodohalobacter sp. SW132]|nr:CHRD domain-containing protein [Rhodohalobacter sp. SW132]
MFRYIAFILGIVFVLSANPEPVYAQRTTEITLGGYNHRPMVRTPAIGFMKVTVEGDSLFVEGEFEELRGVYWSGYIHHGEVGKTGHRLLRLQPTLDENRNSGVFKREENAFLLTDAVRDALRRGRLYINIASNRFQHGEIRGQIPAM